MIQILDKLSVKLIRELDEKILLKSDEHSFDCDKEILMEYFNSIGLVENSKYDAALRQLSLIIEKCPDFMQAVELKNQVEQVNSKNQEKN